MLYGQLSDCKLHAIVTVAIVIISMEVPHTIIIFIGGLQRDSLRLANRVFDPV